MLPVLTLTLGRWVLQLSSYGTLYSVAWVLAPALAAAWGARTRGLPAKESALVFYVSLSIGVLGARVLHVWLTWPLSAVEPDRIWDVDFSGFALYGGLLFASAMAIAMCRLIRLPVWEVADSAIPGLAVGLVLMRTGCFLQGCCFGIPTNRPWGVVYPAGSPAWNRQFLSGSGLGDGLTVTSPVHPTQLYEIVAVILILTAISVLLRLAELPPGTGFLLFALCFSVARLLIHPLRAPIPGVSEVVWGTFYPAFYVLVIATLSVILAIRVRAARAAGFSRTHA